MDDQRSDAPLDHRSTDVAKAVRALRRAGVVGGLSQSLAAAAGALLAREVAGTDTVAGWPQAALVAGAAVSALVLARLTRTRSRRVALATGAGAAALGAVLAVAGATSGSLGLILVGSTLLGAGNTTVMLGRYAAGELAPATRRAREMGWVLGATAVGAVVGPGMLGPSGSLADAVGLPPHAGAYVVATVGYAATAVVLLVGMRELPARPGSTIVGQQTAGPRRRVVRPAMGMDPRRAVAVLSVANLVMVTAMTMAPIHLHHHGLGLDGIGLIVGAHLAGMFAPSPVAGWFTDRFGARPVVTAAGVVLAGSCVTVAMAGGSTIGMVVGLILLGVGWNAAIVAGSAWLTADAREDHRPRLEAYGEVGMGLAAAVGAVLSGLVVAELGYAALAMGCALASVALVPLGRRAPVPGPNRSTRWASPPVATPGLAEEVAR